MQQAFGLSIPQTLEDICDPARLCGDAMITNAETICRQFRQLAAKPRARTA